MDITITVAFTDSSVPATGLSPTINIRLRDTGTLVIDGEALTNIGDGFYTYSFTVANGFQEYGHYVFLIDGGSGLGADDRYKMGRFGDLYFMEV
jgi:hypothetical protein